MSIQLSTRVDQRTKEQFSQVCEGIGITPSNAISIFIKGVINFNGIPFSVVAPHKKPNAGTLQALEDADNGINMTSHASAEALFESWD